MARCGSVVGLVALLVGLGGPGVPSLVGAVRAADRADVKNPFEGDPAAIERGHEVFNERCSFCHGSFGRGAKGPCLTCNRFLYRGGSNAQLFATITGGIEGGQMGAFASSLSAEDIWKVIAFLRDETRKRQAAGDPDVKPAEPDAPSATATDH